MVADQGVEIKKPRFPEAYNKLAGGLGNATTPLTY
jgi:hypothetical protein